MFYDVQDFLDGKRKVRRTSVFTNEEFLLRGYLICHECGRVLTASASKGRNKKYFYYHCHSSCGVRFKTNLVNESFADHLLKYSARPGMADVYSNVLKNVYQRNWAEKSEKKNRFTERLDDLHERVRKARSKFMNDEISKSEYLEFKTECDEEIKKLECKVLAGSNQENQIDDLLKQSVDNLINLRILYENGNNAVQRKIVGSIFPEKVIFDGIDYRTVRESEPLRLIYSIDGSFSKIKTGQNDQKIELSRMVAGTGIEPVFAP